MENPVRARLLEFIKFKQLNNRRFEIICGLSNSYVQNFRGSPKLVSIKKIKNAFPELNIDYILYGKGNMINGEDDNGEEKEETPVNNVAKPNDSKNNVRVDESESLIREILSQKDATINSLRETIKKMKKLAYSARICPPDKKIEDILDEIITECDE